MHDILTDIHRMPPVDTRFVGGRWHRDRLGWDGRLAEARVALQALGGLGSGARTRFLIVGRARSGTTLLARLLNTQSRIACTGELLTHHMWAPVTFLDRVARKSPYEVWGAKLLSYQMVQVHRLKDPVGFCRSLEARGFRFIHLVRDTLTQTLSLAVAQRSRRYHSDRLSETGPSSVRLDPHDFAARLRWSEALLKYEDRIFQEIPHRHFRYEDALLRPEAQAATMADLCDWFGVPFVAAEAPLRKLLPERPEDFVENWDEIAARLHGEGLGHLL